jgi:hypothetical protein
VTLPLLVREMLPEERSLVLSDWKRDLWDALIDDRKEGTPNWGLSLQSEEWWALVNHVLDRITLPSATVWMACHRDEPNVPLCWVAARDGMHLDSHSRVSVRDEPELAAYLQRSLWEHAMPKSRFGIGGRAAFNPFLELKRT